MMKYILITLGLLAAVITATVAYDICQQYVLGRWYNFTINLLLLLVLTFNYILVAHAVAREMDWQSKFDKFKNDDQ